jgi:tRNA(adenine34) deaminase
MSRENYNVKREQLDEQYLKKALELARIAADCGEVPVGAVLVQDDRVIAEAYNRREELGDATAHAEMLVIKEACSLLGGWRLGGCTLYVTLEPCPMCAGAMVQARLDRLVFGTADPKSGAAGTLYDLVRDSRLNHRLEVKGGVLEEDCAKLLQDFFRQRRN